jgi:hypothetical protein
MKLRAVQNSPFIDDPRQTVGPPEIERLPHLAQTRSVDCIKECLSLEANRKTSARTGVFRILTLLGRGLSQSIDNFIGKAE